MIFFHGNKGLIIILISCSLLASAYGVNKIIHKKIELKVNTEKYENTKENLTESNRKIINGK